MEIEDTDGGLVQVARPGQVVARATRSLNEMPGHCARGPHRRRRPPGRRRPARRCPAVTGLQAAGVGGVAGRLRDTGHPGRRGGHGSRSRSRGDVA
ncbi:hypothetical protein [Streptomyces sp. NPDC014805]|uniref:hypothetical protein n=1 Tax=Streptomyces sp. NPDC014805 TaxID=3364919 RepID=UPI0036F97845